MAYDTVELNPGTGGQEIAVDRIGSQDFQRVKLAVGAEGTANEVSSSNPLPISVAAGGISGRAEDSASADGHEGIPLVLVRRDTASSGVDANGDYAMPSVDSLGKIWITGTYAEDAVHASGDLGHVLLAVRQDAAASLVSASGDYSALIVDALGKLWTTGSFAEDAAHTSGDLGNFVLTVRSDTATALATTNGDYAPFITDASGRLHVNVGALPASTNTIEVVGDVAADAAVAGNPVLTGRRASTAVPTAMSADGDSVFAWADRNGATVTAGRIVDDAAFTVATDRVHPVGFMADEASTDPVDEGDAGIARMTLDRKQIVAPYAHAAAGGHLPYKNLDVDESEDDIKTSAGKLFWIYCMNMSNAVKYLKIYNNVAASVTVGTTVPDLTFPIPTMADTNGAGFAIHFGDAGLQFTTGICIAATTGLADNNAGAPGANEVIVCAGYL